MSSEYECMNIVDGDIQLHGDECTEPRRVEHARHSNHSLSGEFADTKRGLCHGIEWIADHNKNAFRRMFDDPLCDVPDDVVVCSQQIVSTHSGLASNSSSNHHH